MFNRLIASCSKQDSQSGSMEVDVGSLIRALILFDEVILQSNRLKEFPSFISAFGYDGLHALLESGKLTILCQANTLGQTGQLNVLAERVKKGLLPLNSFSFSVISVSDHETYYRQALQELHKSDLSLKQTIRLKRAVFEKILPWSLDDVQVGVQQLLDDLRAQSRILKSAVSSCLRDDFAVPKDLAAQLTLQVEEVSQGDFRVDTNLRTLGYADAAEHMMLERSILKLGGLNQRVAQMKIHKAISGFEDRDCPLFEDRLGFLLEGIDPNIQFETFHRVIDIAALPDYIPSVDRIDVPKLLGILDSEECRSFRAWLPQISKTSDSEVADIVRSLRAKLGSYAGSKSGKTLRLLASLGIGVFGLAPAFVEGAVDSFVVDRLFPTSGVWAFVNKMYPSIFVQSDPKGDNLSIVQSSDGSKA